MEPSKASGRRERRKVATRSELIQAGRRLFSEKGLYESRIEDLTAEAGIAKGTLYTYFADKDELIRAVAATGFDELGARVARRVERARSDEEVVRHAVREHLQFFAANPDLMRVLHQVRGMLKFDRPGWRPLRVTMNRYLESLAQILSTSAAIARLPMRDRLEIARLVFGAVSGVTSVNTTSRPRAMRGRAETQPLVNALAAMVWAYVDSWRRRRAEQEHRTRMRAKE